MEMNQIMSKGVYEVLETMYALKRQKNIIYFVTFIFFSTFIVSYILLYLDVAWINSYGSLLYDSFLSKVDSFNISEGGSLRIISVILGNNILVALFNYVLMIFSIVNIMLNAFLLSYVLHISETLKFILLVTPHGIVEIPALILSGSSGILLFIALIKKFGKLLKGSKSSETGSEIYKIYYHDSLRILGVSIVLFVIAAIIEGTITYQIAQIL